MDDVVESLDLLAGLLDIAGYSVRLTQHGEMALLSAQASPPDLILLDIRMPGMDGYEVCRRLKADRRTVDIPIIILSALDDDEAMLEGFRVGAVDYVAKPFHAEEVLARVRTQIELRKLRLGLEEMVQVRTAQLEAEIAERKQATQRLLESRQKLAELSGHLEEVREEERKRIARELHDELGQGLTVLRIDLVHFLAQLDVPKQQLKEKVSAFIGTLDQVADAARAISENLRPGMLDVLGLSAAVQHHVGKFMDSTAIRCVVKMNQNEFDVDSKIATAAFRILQESLTNVARHAQAKNVEVQLASLGEELILVVQDDGCGIAERRAARRPGFGLIGMQERVKLLGGGFLIESNPEQGTRIEVNFPIKVAEER